MPRMVRQSRGFVKRAPVRYAWCPASLRDVPVSGGTTVLSADLLATMVTDMGRETAPGMVVERIIGTLVVSASLATEFVNWTAGIRVIDEGQNTPLTVDTEIGRWLWWSGGLAAGGSQTGTTTFRPIFYRHEFDVHGRWRLDDVGDQLKMSIINHEAEDDLLFSLWTRTLLRIP